MKTLPRFAAWCALVVTYLSVSRADIYVMGELSQDREARPGETYNGSITIRNDAKEEAEAKIYQTDYLFYAEGTNIYGTPGSSPRSNASWISFRPARVTIPAKGSVNVEYTVSVPPDTMGRVLVGSYWSMLMIEEIPSGSAESAVRNKSAREEMTISQNIRYGLQIATHIAGTGTRAVNFKDAKLVSGDKGVKTLQLDIENTGDLGIRPEVYVELFNQTGVSVGKFPGNRYRIYPGTSIRQWIQFPGVAPGDYKAVVVIDAGGDDVFGAQYSLKF